MGLVEINEGGMGWGLCTCTCKNESTSATSLFSSVRDGGMLYFELGGRPIGPYASAIALNEIKGYPVNFFRRVGQ